MRFSIPCVLLCGGRSTRMGQLKQDLLIGNANVPKKQETLANFQARHLQQWFLSLYFSAKFEIPNTFGIATILDLSLNADNAGKDFNQKIHLADARDWHKIPKSKFAPIFGLQSILEFLQCDVFVISIDTPFLDCDSIAMLWRAYTKNPKPTFAKNTKIHPLLGIYTLESLAKIKAQIAKGDYKLMRLLENINAQFVEIDEDKTLNLNTLEDYQKACKQMES
ncbi:molybdenum cofactor guanylyltransferase [Helicobacter sp. UBA3407]|uniref:molybdenum cofactor guanylyltransferase n=1 Tax=Helicobacter TaxID=209 RepID=UPI0026058DAD|nr:molybdenum cofactor guanylyltransferase [Helicobacter sp. UBA3407]